MLNTTTTTQQVSLPVGTRSVGYLTKLLEPTFNEAQFEEQFLQWEYDINRYEKDNGTARAALPDGIKIAILLNKTKGALQQPPTASWTDHELHRDQSTHLGLLQDDFSLH